MPAENVDLPLPRGKDSAADWTPEARTRSSSHSFWNRPNCIGSPWPSPFGDRQYVSMNRMARPCREVPFHARQGPGRVVPVALERLPATVTCYLWVATYP